MVQAKAELKGVLRLQKGSKVQLQGLNNSKELNGLVGHLLEFDQVKLRWGVELENGKCVALKMGNLIPLATDLEQAVEIPFLGPTAVNLPVVALTQSTASDDATEVHVGGDGVPQGAGVAVALDVDETTEEVASSAPALPVEQLPSISPGEALIDGSVPLDDNEWPVLPTSAETKAIIQSGCWWDGGSAAKRFTEQLASNDPALISVCLVPPKRFNDEDAKEICDALEFNTSCEELVASGHVLSTASVERLANTLRSTKTLQHLSVGESSFGDLACILFDGLAQNTSLTSLDVEHKGLTDKACRSLSMALEARSKLGVVPLETLKLSKNALGVDSLAGFANVAAPKDLSLSECTLSSLHGKSLGLWVSRGVEVLDLRANSRFGGEGVELLMLELSRAGAMHSPVLRSLRLDNCSIGDDGLEMIADAVKRGLALDDLFVEHCEITKVGCAFLEESLRGKRLRTLSVRANVIGDEGCSLLARCAERLDLSSTNLSGQILPTLGEHALVSLELFSNPSLGLSVSTWLSALDSTQWQRLEYLDITGCGLQDEGFECVCNTLIQRQDLMPSLKDLLIGANDVKEDDDKCDLVDKLGESRGGRLATKWLNA